MSVLIENPAACEMRCVIRFLNVKKVKPIEIYRQICEVYGQNAMSDSMVRRWVRHSMKDVVNCTMKSEVGVHL
ncbi:uncharacterized protein TNCV_286881 [Trichonephila clavipes]|nr:uncharacterized protein TNCV_286881 [Trichonephila clavipes]